LRYGCRAFHLFLLFEGGAHVTFLGRFVEVYRATGSHLTTKHLCPKLISSSEANEVILQALERIGGDRDRG
jgi:hypothetical protein